MHHQYYNAPNSPLHINALFLHPPSLVVPQKGFDDFTFTSPTHILLEGPHDGVKPVATNNSAVNTNTKTSNRNSRTYKRTLNRRSQF